MELLVLKFGFLKNKFKFIKIMLSPKRTKFKKMHRGRLKGIATKNTKLEYGIFGLQALESAWITSKQIEAVRRTISRYTKRSGKLWIKIFPDKSVTHRAAESRMGSGKGSVDHWVAVVKKGNILFELNDILKDQALNAFKIASYKLPIKTKIISK